MLRRLVVTVFILLAVVLLAALAAVVLIDPDDYRDRIAREASDQLGREVRLDGPIELRLFPWLAFEIQDASVGNPPDFASAPLLAEIGLARASIRLWPLLRGELEVGAIDFEDAIFTLVSDREGRSNLDGLFAAEVDDAPATDAPPDLSTLQTGPIGLRAVRVVILDLATGQRQELVIDSVALAPFRPDHDVDLSLDGRLVIDDETIIEDLDLDGIVHVAADLGRIGLSDLRAGFALPGAGAAVRADAEVAIELARTPLEVNIPRLDLELELAEATLGLTLVEPLLLTLAEPPRMALPGAELRLDGQVLALAGDLTLGDPVSGAMNVSGQRLDLRALAALGENGDTTGDAAGSGEAVDFTPLQGFDLRLDLRVDELILADGLQLDAVAADSRLSGGVLVLDPMQAEVFGGRFEGRTEVDFNQAPPAVHLQPRLSGVMVERVAGLFSEHAPVAGRGELALDLRFRGLDLGDILASLDGAGDFAINEGAVRGIDLQRLIEQELTVASLANVRQAFSGETPFRQLSGSLRADGGVVTLPDLDFAAAGFGARGSGRIDFQADRVDYQLELDLGESLAERLPRSLRSATGGRIPLSIAGPVAEPVISIDLAGIAERAARDEVGRRLLERLDRSDPDADSQESAADDPDVAEARDGEQRGSRQLLRGLLDARERRSDADEETGEVEAVPEGDDVDEDDAPPPAA